MTITVEYANQNDSSVVNYHFDDNSMTILPASDQRVVDFVNAGGIVGQWQSPPPPPTVDQLDTSALNAALVAPGSVVRALGLIVFDIATGKIPVNPNYTMTQYVNLLKAKMR